MKIAYIFIHKNKKNKSVLKKVYSQFKNWEGVEKKLFIISKDNIFYNDENVVWIPLSNQFLNILNIYKNINLFKPDIIYHRIWLLSPFLILLKLKKYKLVGELNSNVNEELKNNKYSTVRSFFIHTYNRITYKFYYKLLSGIVSLTYEMATDITCKKSVIPNSIDLYEKNTIKNKINSNRVVFIGTPGYEWQGIDIIKKISNLSHEDLHFDVIGFENNGCIDYSNITWHGFIDSNKYEKILLNAAVGLGTPALFRKNHSEACPLKVREYLRFGLPVILPYDDTSFLNKDNDWLLRVNFQNHERLAYETLKIIDFVKKMQNVIVEKHMLERYISIKNSESKRIAFFREVNCLDSI